MAISAAEPLHRSISGDRLETEDSSPSWKSRLFLLVLSVASATGTALGLGFGSFSRPEEHQLRSNFAFPLTNVTTNRDFLPPLSRLVEGDTVKSDVRDLLDFAVVGFPKCGTTFLLHYFRSISETFMGRHEWCHLSRDEPAKLVEQMLVKAPHSRSIKRGLKCPKDIETKSGLGHYVNHFNKTKMIVGVRHPILWFQSYHNFMAYKHYPWHVGNTSDFIAACDHKVDPFRFNGRHICTDRASFHHALSRLGKTPISTEEEKSLLKHKFPIDPFPSQVFLVEVSQLNEDVPEYASQLKSDFRDFLGLNEELPPLIHPSKKRKYPEATKREHFINICNAEHAELRRVLVENGRKSSTWIRKYFLESPDVFVSSRSYFIELIKKWEQDPCEGELQ